METYVWNTHIYNRKKHSQLNSNMYFTRNVYNHLKLGEELFNAIKRTEENTIESDNAVREYTVYYRADGTRRIIHALDEIRNEWFETLINMVHDEMEIDLNKIRNLFPEIYKTGAKSTWWENHYLREAELKKLEWLFNTLQTDPSKINLIST